MLDKTVIDKATDRRYTEFSADIKAELERKMANHPVAREYASEIDRIQDLKTSFADITNSQDEE